MTAVIRLADAVLHAAMMIKSSMMLSLMSPGAVVCKTKTLQCQHLVERYSVMVGIPSSSLTDSPIVTEVSWFEYWRTIIFVSSVPKLRAVSGSLEAHLKPGIILVCHQFRQLRVTVARQELDRVCGCHGLIDMEERLLCP